MTAPPRPETNRRVDGFPFTSGLNKCGTTNPTKPIAPQTAVAAPTEEATPNTRSNFVFVNEMDREEATSSPRVNASSAFPMDPIISQPIKQKGNASHTCSKDLSARDPINQNTISEVAYGFGDRLRASDVNAPAKALTAIPASISVKELPRGPANNRRSNTAKVAKENAAIGRPIQT